MPILHPHSLSHFTGYSIHFITRFASLQSTLDYIFHSISPSLTCLLASLSIPLFPSLSFPPYLALLRSFSTDTHRYMKIDTKRWHFLLYPIFNSPAFSLPSPFLLVHISLSLSFSFTLPRSKVLIISWNVVNHGISFVLFPFDFQLNFSFEFSC